MPDLDPDPIPNIVIHPGDALAFPHDGGPYASCIRLLDRHGKCYAVLECSTLTDDWIIDTIRFVSAEGGVLPVRSQSDANSITVADDPNLHTGDIPNPDARPTNLILSNFGRVTDLTDISAYTESTPLSSLTVTHAHPHSHLGSGAGDYFDPNVHDHEHTHAGADAFNHSGPNYAYDHTHDEDSHSDLE